MPLLDDGAGQLCAICHSSQYADYPGAPYFLGASPAEYYAKLVSQPVYVNAAPGNSRLMTQGLHEGPGFTDPQKQQVAAWLQMEAAVRFGGGTSGSSDAGAIGPTGEEMLNQYGDCMTLEDWTTTGMHLVANQPNSAKSNCYGCHNSGMSANYMANPGDEAAVADAFSHMRYPTPLTKLVTYEIDPTTGQFSKLVQAYQWRDKGQAPTLHPKYVLDTNYQNAIDAWFALTLDKCAMGDGSGAGGGSGSGSGGAGGGI
jgi:hypothetical protein